MKEAIEVCKESLKDHSENKTNIPLRINLPVKIQWPSTIYAGKY